MKPLYAKPVNNPLDEADVEIFKQIFKSRLLRRDQLLGEMGDAPAIGHEAIDTAISRLERQQLVQVIPGVIDDFDTILVTADGFRLADITNI